MLRIISANGFEPMEERTRDTNSRTVFGPGPVGPAENKFRMDPPSQHSALLANPGEQNNEDQGGQKHRDRHRVAFSQAWRPELDSQLVTDSLT